MPYTIHFISLGCAKNVVNCEQMMELCRQAGYTVAADPAGADVAVVNTCGFLQSACEEAIDNILEMAELKRAGQVQKILVTGCMAQRYKEDVLTELPDVDGGAVWQLSLCCLENARDILLALETEYRSLYARNLTLARLGEAVILPLCPDKGPCMTYDLTRAASTYLDGDIEQLRRMR